MTDELDRILGDDPPPPASPFMLARIMHAVRAAAEPPPRITARFHVSLPALAGTALVAGLALAVYLDVNVLGPAAAALIPLAIWWARLTATEFES